MSNEIQVAHSNLPTVTTPQMVFTNSGDNGVQIANQAGATVNVHLPALNGTLFNAATSINHEFYNLFVVGENTLRDNTFLIGKTCALTISAGVAPEISRRFAALTPKAQNDIKTYPSLFASRNHHFGNTNTAHNAILGLVTDIEILDSNIRISFQGYCQIPQQRLIGLSETLQIQAAAMANEFDRPHWSIKPVPLVSELRKEGFNLPAPF
jgi:hypothetical protein